MHSLSIFRVRTSHGQLPCHMTHHGPDVGEATTFSLIVYFVHGHRTSTQMAFCLGGVPKFPKLVLLWLWGPITLRSDLRFRWSLNQICSLHQELSNNMSHATYTQVNWGDSWLLVVGNQTTNLTPDPSFGHNLCFGCPNGSCKPT